MAEGGPRHVVIHADDLGMSHGANAAFQELSELGACSSGSVMVPCPWFPEIVSMTEAKRSLDVGVHLTLTSEMRRYKWRPLTAPPRSAGLTDEQGFFLPLPRLVRQGASREAVERELRAQVETALASGLDVTHLDDHAGTVLLPEFCDIYIRIGRDYRLPILITEDLATYGGQHNMQGVAAADYRHHAETARKAGFHIFDRIIETPWRRVQDMDRLYRDLISSILPGYTFMALHFTRPGEITMIDDAWSSIRTGEYELFRSRPFRDWLAAEGLSIISMRQFRDEFLARTFSKRAVPAAGAD